MKMIREVRGRAASFVRSSFFFALFIRGPIRQENDYVSEEVNVIVDLTRNATVVMDIILSLDKRVFL